MTDYDRIAEGLCPSTDHGHLERRDHFGWCSDCACGWSIENGAIFVHVKIDGQYVSADINATPATKRVHA